MSYFIKIRPVGVYLFHEGGRTDRHDEANRSLFAILRTRRKNAFKRNITKEIKLRVMCSGILHLVDWQRVTNVSQKHQADCQTA